MKSFEQQTNIINETADELHRIHCYAETFATLCKTGGQNNAISPEYLEQIFRDIANVTAKATNQLYTLANTVEHLN